MQSLFAFLSNLVLFLTMTTLAFAVGACLAVALRKRMPLRRRRAGGLPGNSVLLRRYVPRESE